MVVCKIDHQREQVLNLFQNLDVHGNGTIDFGTFLEVFRSVSGTSAEEAQNLFIASRAVDVRYSEFLTFLYEPLVSRASTKKSTEDPRACLTEGQHAQLQIGGASVATIANGVTDERRRNYSALLDKVDMTRSKELQRYVAEHLKEGEIGWQQDRIYTGSGLNVLLADAKAAKCEFDKLCSILAESLAKMSGTPCHFLGARVKGRLRAGQKVSIKNLGDASMLTDAVRGTLVLEAASAELMSSIYDFLHAMISGVGKSEASKTIIDAMKSAGARVKHFDDRYAKPLGDYRDWLLVVEVAGFATELQINFDVAIAMKEGHDHQIYEAQRKADDQLLEAAMHGNTTCVAEAIMNGAKPSNSRLKDANGFTPLHYSACHGAEMTMCLLEHHADPLAGDKDDLLPFNRAVMRNDEAIVRCLLKAMLARKSQLAVLPERKKHAVLCAWSASKSRDASYTQDLYEILCVAIPMEDDQMHCAARAGNAPACQAVWKKKQNINCWQFDAALGLSVWPLDQAILAGSLDAVCKCLELGGRLYAEGPHKDPQAVAESYASSDAGQHLLTMLAVDKYKPLHGDKDEKKSKPWGEAVGTPLDLAKLVSLAIKSNAFFSLRVLADHGAQLLDSMHEEVGDALRKNAGCGKASNVSLLLSMKAEVNAVDEGLRTPLWFAAAAGERDACDILINAQADIDRQNKLERSPLWAAAMHGRIDVIKCLLAAHADPNKPASNGTTPACVAAWKGFVVVLECLHQGGADLGRSNTKGETPAHMGALYGFASVLEFLQSIGLPLDMDTGGSTPMHKVCESAVDRLDVFSILEKAGADLSRTNSSGKTPAHLAALNGRVGITKALKEAGVDFNCQDTNGVTPAHLAAQKGTKRHLNILKIIRDAGADLNHQNNKGWVPAHWAAKKGNMDVIKMLHESGADLMVADKTGMNPADVGAEHQDMLLFLESCGVRPNRAKREEGNASDAA